MQQNRINVASAQRLQVLLDSQCIRRDAEGRFNLADIHEMAGRRASDAATHWGKGAHAQKRLDEYSTRHPDSTALVVVRNGPNAERGTYAVAELAIAYADWIGSDLGQRVRAAIAAGGTVKDSLEFLLLGSQLLQEAAGAGFTLTIAASNEDDAVEKMPKGQLLKFVQDYIKDRKVVRSRDISEIIKSLLGDDVPAVRIGMLLSELGCQWKNVGNGQRLMITPLGFASGLSLESTEPDLLAAWKAGRDAAVIRLAAAA